MLSQCVSCVNRAKADFLDWMSQMYKHRFQRTPQNAASRLLLVYIRLYCHKWSRSHWSHCLTFQIFCAEHLHSQHNQTTKSDLSWRSFTDVKMVHSTFKLHSPVSRSLTHTNTRNWHQLIGAGYRLACSKILPLPVSYSSKLSCILHLRHVTVAETDCNIWTAQVQ